MKKLFTILAVALCSTLAMAQTNQYFWAGGQFIMGNPINQIDSITFGQLEQTDSITLYLPHTVKVVHDTVIQKEYIYDTMYIAIHDTICPEDAQEGSLPGLFSVSKTLKVYFSKGNLQYNATNGTHVCADGSTKNGTWKFAEHQYDIIGNANANISSTYSGYIDLFGFGTSGYNGIMPYENSTSNSKYPQANITNTYSDWGLYNPIINGGNQAGVWRTLSNAEWKYLLKERADAQNKAITVTINGIKGYIVLPDEWETPTGLTLTPTQKSFSTNTYTLTQWEKLELAGAAFFPAGNTRNGTYMYSSNYWGNYWSTTYIGNYKAYDFSFSVSTPTAEPSNSVPIYYGRSVRLVHEAK